MFTAVILVWVSLFKRIYSHPTISNVRFCSTLRLKSLYPPRSVWSPDWETTDGRLNNIHVIAGPAAGIYILMEPIHFRYPGLEIIWDRSKCYIYLWDTSSLGTDCLLLGFLDCWPIRGCMLLFSLSPLLNRSWISSTSNDSGNNWTLIWVSRLWYSKKIWMRESARVFSSFHSLVVSRSYLWLLLTLKRIASQEVTKFRLLDFWWSPMIHTHWSSFLPRILVHRHTYSAFAQIIDWCIRCDVTD